MEKDNWIVGWENSKLGKKIGLVGWENSKLAKKVGITSWRNKSVNRESK